MAEGLVALLLGEHRQPLQPVRQLVVAAAHHEGSVGEPALSTTDLAALDRVQAPTQLAGACNTPETWFHSDLQQLRLLQSPRMAEVEQVKNACRTGRTVCVMQALEQSRGNPGC